MPKSFNTFRSFDIHGDFGANYGTVCVCVCAWALARLASNRSRKGKPHVITAVRRCGCVRARVALARPNTVHVTIQTFSWARGSESLRLILSHTGDVYP